jgi:hypothetical protein
MEGLTNCSIVAKAFLEYEKDPDGSRIRVWVLASQSQSAIHVVGLDV